jgi:tetratricopeptide (TPR) repeat protein
MNSSASSTRSPDVESIEERVGSLYEELELAVRWERPSILIAVYESEFVRQRAETILAGRLSALGQRAVPFRVSGTTLDVPVLLAQDPARGSSVYFVSGLRWGGGKGGYEAFRALNLHREYFVEAQVRVVLWLTRSEAGDLPHHAPDFWAFRHRVIEFVDAPSPRQENEAAAELSWGAWDARDLLEDVDGRIAFREQQLARLPLEDGALAARLDLLYPLAALYWARGDLRKSGDLARQGLQLADRLGETRPRARFQAGLGLLDHALGRGEQALAAYQKAVQLDPTDPLAWNNLALVHRDLGRPDEALRACQQALELDPSAERPWTTLGRIYAGLGRLQDASQALHKATRLAAKDARPWLALGKVERDLGRLKQARSALAKATRLDPDSFESWKTLADLDRSLDRPKTAVKAYRAALALRPEDAGCRAALEACQQKAAPTKRFPAGGRRG